MDIVKVISLKKKYVSGKIEVNAINGIDLYIKKGEFLAITGPSGSGKSTLLNIVGGNEFPTEGVVEINKRILSSMNDEELTIFRRRNIGFVFQRFNLIPYLNIYQNIVLPLELDHADIDSEFVKELIDELGLDDQIFKMPDELSGGQQQRVGIARALAANARIMLMDEPFGALDEITKQAMQDEILKLHRKLGITIVFITHDIREAMKLGDRVLVMDQGKIVQLDTPEKIKKEPANEFVYQLVGQNLL